MSWLTGHIPNPKNHQHICILSAVLKKGKENPSEVECKEWKLDPKVFSCRFRDDKWIPPFLNPGSGVSESWGGLVFHMALLDGEDLALAKSLRGRLHAAFTLFNRAFDQRGQDERRLLGFLHADLGVGGPEVPSALAAAHGGVLGRFHRRAAERQRGLLHRHQQGVRRRLTARFVHDGSISDGICSGASRKALANTPGSSLVTTRPRSPSMCGRSSLSSAVRWELMNPLWVESPRHVELAAVLLRSTSTAICLRGTLSFWRRTRKPVIMWNKLRGKSGGGGIWYSFWDLQEPSCFAFSSAGNLLTTPPRVPCVTVVGQPAVPAPGEESLEVSLVPALLLIGVFSHVSL